MDIYIYIYIYRERERGFERGFETGFERGFLGPLKEGYRRGLREVGKSTFGLGCETREREVCWARG